jgi:hypothetical protein
MKKIIVIQIAALLLAIAANAQVAANDNFANAQVLSGDVVSATNNNQNATLETGEPTATGYFTLWYAWTAPDTGEATINLNGSANFTQVLTVWMGNSVSGLKAVVSGYPVTFPVVAGTVYHICTGSYYNNQYGNIQVNISLNTSSSLDSLTFIGTGTTTNDNFVNRIVTSTEYGSFVAYNGSATREALETTPGYFTMWWTYHAPANGRLDINDVGDGTWTFTKYISVWSGTAVQSLELLTPSVTGGDCNLPVIQGNDYQVCISSYYNNQNGPIVLTFSLNTSSDLNSFNLSGGATFTNDNFNSATVLTRATPAVIAYNTYATREALEATPGYNTVWFKWTAPAAGSTQILTQGSDSFNKYLTIYTGTAINALTQVAQPAAAAAPTASFAAIAGQTYYICVGSYYNNQSGSILLSIFGQPGTPTGPTLTIGQAFKLQFPTVTNTTYRVQQSSDLQTWNTLTNVITGNGYIQQVFVDPQGAANEMYRVTAQ